MSPQERQMLRELYEWMQARKSQQLTYPVDDVSKAAIAALISSGTLGTGLTQTIALSGNPENISVPAAYAGYLLIDAEGAQRKVPYVA